MKDKNNLKRNKEMDQNIEIKKNWKYYLGITLFIFSWIPYISSGILLFLEIPPGKLFGIITILIASSEISFVISIVLLGKTFIKILKTKILGIFFRNKEVQPAKLISKTRYYIGIILLLLSLTPDFSVDILLLFGYPKTDSGHVYMFIGSLLGYTVFIISLFVLGSDFWERAKKLFYWNGEDKS